MKILVIDDVPRKYSRLVKLLEPLGISDADLTFVISADSARRELLAKAFDFMILDILLPLRDVEEPDYHNSVDLLAELVESTELHRPLHIVGITADPEAAAKASPVFGEQLWTVIEYSEANDEWLGQLVNCIQYAQDAERSPVNISYDFDLVVVCALPDPELRQVLALPWGFKAARPVDEHLFIHEGAFTSQGHTFKVAAVACPRMGMVAASLTTSRAIKALRPRIIAMTGICAGIAGKVALGEVIFADPVWDWQSGKYLREVDKEAQFLLSPHQAGPIPAMRAYAEQLRADKTLLSEISNAGPDDPPAVLKLSPGPIATGSAVIANSDVAGEIRAQNRDTLGIEMECYGFFVAAESASSPRPIAVAFKAVCDFADALKNDTHQRYASYTSATVMRYFVERYGANIISSQKFG